MPHHACGLLGLLLLQPLLLWLLSWTATQLYDARGKHLSLQQLRCGFQRNSSTCAISTCRRPHTSTQWRLHSNPPEEILTCLIKWAVC